MKDGINMTTNEASSIRKMQCELCGSIEIRKNDEGFFQCQSCGCQYTLEQAKALIGTVIINNYAVQTHLINNISGLISAMRYKEASSYIQKLYKEFPLDYHWVWFALRIMLEDISSGVNILVFEWAKLVANNLSAMLNSESDISPADVNTYVERRLRYIFEGVYNERIDLLIDKDRKTNYSILTFDGDVLDFDVIYSNEYIRKILDKGKQNAVELKRKGFRVLYYWDIDDRIYRGILIKSSSFSNNYDFFFAWRNCIAYLDFGVPKVAYGSYLEKTSNSIDTPKAYCNNCACPVKVSITDGKLMAKCSECNRNASINNDGWGIRVNGQETYKFWINIAQ